MHEISKLYVVAFHFTSMGTSCISSVSARHDFEQVVFIGWLSNKILLEYVLHSTIGLCPNENIGGLSTVLIRVCPNEIYRRVVHSIIGVCSNEIYIYIYIYRRVVQHFIGVCPINLREN